MINCLKSIKTQNRSEVEKRVLDLHVPDPMLHRGRWLHGMVWYTVQFPCELHVSYVCTETKILTFSFFTEKCLKWMPVTIFFIINQWQKNGQILLREGTLILIFEYHKLPRYIIHDVKQIHIYKLCIMPIPSVVIKNKKNPS